jgi:hypothetical protein
VKVVLVAPADTVTLAGTIANVLLLLMPTTTPPDGATALWSWSNTDKGISAREPTERLGAG